MNESKVLNVSSESQTETTYISSGTSEASVGTSPQVLGSQSNNNDSNVYLGQENSSAIGSEGRILDRTEQTTTETVQGESGLGSASVGTEARTSVSNEESQVGVYVANENDYSDTSRTLQVSEEQNRGAYVVQTQKLGGFERSKGEKNVVNTITVDEVKALIKKYGGTNDVYTKEEIDHIVETMRKGLYQEVNTTEYPTLEDFLDSDGEEGIIYLYPVGNEGNNYYQYIWETTKEWISLGTTVVDLSQYVTLATDQNITGLKRFSGGIQTDSNNQLTIKGNVGQNLYNFTHTFFRSSNNNTVNLGESDKRWKDLYLSGSVNFDYAGAVGKWSIKQDGLNQLSVYQELAQTYCYQGSQFFSLTNADLGNTGRKWTNGYFSGQVYAQNTFNLINASDIVNNTLTQAQYDLITNGKPTLILGTYLNYKNMLITYWTEYSTTWRALAIAEATVFSVLLNTNNKTLSIGGDDIKLKKLASINDKQFPQYPTNNPYPQILQIGSGGGALSWGNVSTNTLLGSTTLTSDTNGKIYAQFGNIDINLITNKTILIFTYSNCFVMAMLSQTGEGRVAGNLVYDSLGNSVLAKLKFETFDNQGLVGLKVTTDANNSFGGNDPTAYLFAFSVI